MRLTEANTIRIFVRTLLVLLFFSTAPSEAQTLKILPLGNSITYGTNSSPDPEAQNHGAYRLRLHNLLDQAGYNVDFIGSRSSGYALFPDAQHCGLPGISSYDLASILQTGYNPSFSYQNFESNGPYLNSYTPDIILLEIGTNDLMSGDIYDLSEFDNIFDLIDAKETNLGRPILVFVGKIISTETGSGACNQDPSVNTFNSNLTSLVNSRISNGDKLVLVDMQCSAGINYSSDMLDTYHPNADGYDKMGELFFDYIDNFNSAPVLTQIPNQTIPEGNAFATIHLDDYIYDNEDDDSEIIWTISPTTSENLNISVVNRTVSISPKNPEWSGQVTFTFTASDRGKVILGLRKTKSCQAVFKVNAVNDPPSIILPVNREGEVNVPFAEVIRTEDDDNDVVFLNATTKPAWLNFSSATNTLYGIPGPANSGNQLIIMEATDGKATVDSTLIIYITPLSPVIDGEGTSFEVFPNPASVGFKVRASGDRIHTIQLFDLKGNLLLSKEFGNSGEVYFETGTLAPGMVLYRVITDKDTHTGKLTIR